MWKYLVCLFVLTTAVQAQFESATLTGVVTDPAGSVVPNAAVRAVNEATNIELSVVTNSEGRYVLPNLRPGSYQVIASAQGFKQFVSSGVVLQEAFSMPSPRANLENRRTLMFSPSFDTFSVRSAPTDRLVSFTNGCSSRQNSS